MSYPYGALTRELRCCWFGRAGYAPTIAGDRVQRLFNDMDLYPTKSQVYEMLWCAGQCGNLSGTSSGHSSSSTSPDVITPPYLSFGDYSVFASEMKRAYADEGTQTAAPASKIAHKNNEIKLPTTVDFINKCNAADKSSVQCEVFLGGSCNPTTWRQDIAVPMLKNLDITYFNPQVTDWDPRLIELEHQAIENADVLFYVIDNQTRAIVVMIEVAYFVAKQRNVILVISGFKEPGQRILNEPISEIEYEDLTSCQLILQDLVERHGIPVFNDIQTALKCTAKIVREKIKPQDLKLSDLAQPVKMGHVQIGNKLINLRKTFDNLDSSNSGEISLSDVRMAYRILTNRELTKDEVVNVLDGIKRADKELIITQAISEPSIKKETNGFNGTKLNFEQFCCIMSELMYHHYCKSTRTWSNLLSTKANYFVQNISVALTRLLENVPGSKPGWMPLLSKPDAELISEPLYDVYLGGDCSPSANWRSEDAISSLKKHGLSYFNPEANNLRNRNIPIDKAAIDRCRVVLFNLPASARSLENMTMAAYYLGLGCRVVVCIGYLQDECQINEEKLSKVAVKDYNRGRAYLSDMATKEGIPVFEDVKEAIQCVIEKCKVISTL